MKRTLNRFIALKALTGILLIFGYSAGSEPYGHQNSRPPKSSITLSREDAVREAVFKYQIEHGFSVFQERDVVFFLSLAKDANPSDALLARFTDRHPPVKKVSESIPKGGGIADKRTGKAGIIFRITSIKWMSETEAEVEGGYYEGNLSSSGNVYRVVYENNQWVVKKDDMKWIS